jgi:DNA polymerase III epsilon subunit-like protein
MSRSLIALDCETTLIGPGAIVPKLICTSFADESGALLLGNGDSLLEPFLRETFENDEVVGHNVGFDLAVVCKAFPSLKPAVFKALEEGRIHDTILREKLIFLGTTGDLENFHGKRIEYSLAALAYRRLGVDLSASKSGPDIWRLRFGELEGRRAADYPAEAAEYAKKDALVTREIFVDQDSHRHLFKVAPVHVRAAFCLQLMADRGLKVDKHKKTELEATLDRELDTLKLVYEPIERFGNLPLITPPQPPRPYARGTGMTQAQPAKVNKSKVLQPLVKEVCEKHGKPVKMTKPSGKFPNGQISTKNEWLKEIAHLHPTLSEHVFREERIKLKRDFFPALEWPPASGVVADVVSTRWDPLKKTGRVASAGNSKKSKAPPLYPAMHIQGASAVKIGADEETIRDCYVAREGFVFAVADYNAIDLCAAAQTMHDLFGGSALEDQINAGIDPHAFLGAVLAYEEDHGFRRDCDEFNADGKLIFAMFGDKAKYVQPCPCEARGKGKHKKGWYEHWRTFAKVFGLGVPGGMGLDTLCAVAAGYGLSLDRDTAARLRKRYFKVHPEVRRYLRQWVPEQKSGDSPNGEDRYQYVSPSGMVRAGCSYTEFANGRALQTPAAEGFKQAMWLVTKECYLRDLGSPLYGSFPVVNMHDELVVEVPEAGASEAAERLSQLMVIGMQSVLKDVQIRAEPVLTRRWTKKAKAVKGPDGKLRVWEPNKTKVAA